MEDGVDSSRGVTNASSSNTEISPSEENLDLELEDAEVRKDKRIKGEVTQNNPPQNNYSPFNLNSSNTQNNPIFQSVGNRAEDSIDYGDLPTEHRMEYQLNPINDNRSMAVDSAESEHNGTAAQNHYGNAASFTQE
ncbi:hypothetical protein C5167_015072 [Papaver somniferum]|uniref:Uncharacterized protein n=1 Tax=Papaver somniferum TaxID=3469 RepID=A0A4Y7J8F9_PAPSO|nr:hypothetical protein C5167_015072 [Papaver somniferum]